MVLAAEMSGVSRTAVALPKGGGAQQGIGETFQADPHSGTYQVTVPIDVPPGRGRQTPQLALSYNSAAGNDPFGLGWSLAVPAINRSARKGIPEYGDTDAFLLDEADLIMVADWRSTERGTRERLYRRSGEHASDRLAEVRSGPNHWWELTDPAGMITLFGPDGDSQLRDGPAQVFGWFAAATTDTVGNRVAYRYRTDGAHRQLYLSRVDYCDTPATGGWLYSVVFDYGDRDDHGADGGTWSERDDAFSTFRAGFEIRTVRRCRRILVLLNHPGGTGADVISRYDLAYEAAGGNAVSLLRSVTKTGVRRRDGGTEEQAQPPLEFRYAPWRPGSGQVTEYTDVPRIHQQYGVELLDGQGYGSPGMVQYTRAEHHYIDIGADRTARQRRDQSGPDLPLGSGYVHLVDMTGDGYVDLVRFAEPWEYYRANPGRGWDHDPTRMGDRVPFIALLARGRIVDVDGDGAADFIGVTAAGTFAVHHNHGDKGWSQTARTAPIPADCRPDFTTSRTRLADMSGDGPIDLVDVGSPAADTGTCRIVVKYWPHSGHGVFVGHARSLPLPLLRLEDGRLVDPLGPMVRLERLLLADVDGDGYDDVVYLRATDAVVWLNQSGNRFGPPVSIPLRTADESITAGGLGPSLDDRELTSIRVADLGGRGTIGVLWSPAGGETTVRWAPLAPDTKPYLLTYIDDHRGATVEISYRTSASFAYDDAFRAAQWRTHVPFPVHLVAQVRVTDAFSRRNVTSRFRYHEGVWDGVEREFRGFAQVDQYDTEVGQTTVVPVLTRLWFHVGVAGHAADTAEPVPRGCWPHDPPQLPRSGATARLLDGLDPAGRRRALRALSGKPLRTERFQAAADPAWLPDPDIDRPYSVTEYSYDLGAGCDPRAPADRRSDPVVMVLRRGERTTQWERGRDPMTRMHFELAHDEYGRPQLLADADAPRTRGPARPGAAAPAGTGTTTTTDAYLLTVTVRAYATDASRNILDRVAADVRYEAAGVPAGIPDDLARYLEQRWQDGPDTSGWRTVAATATYYDGAAFAGAPLGTLDQFGLATCVIRLVHTPDTLAAVFGDEPQPPWLNPGAVRDARSWPAEYPEAFQTAYTAAAEAGGGYHPRPAREPALPDGLYLTEVARRHDTQHPDAPHRCGLVLASRDAAGVETVVDPDPPWLLPATVTTAGLLEQHTVFDYRTQQPLDVTDANGYHSRYTYTPLGLLHTVTRTGPEQAAGPEELGDSPADPGVQYAYGLTEYDDSPPEARRPAWVHTRSRMLDPETTTRLRRLFPGPALELVAERRDYSDGLDRLLQFRISRTSPSVRDVGLIADPPAPLRIDPAPPATSRQPTGGWIIRGPDGRVQGIAPGSALPVSDDPAGPLVRVDGWVAYDDKDRIVERYEPFLDDGWAYHTSPATHRHGIVHRVLIDRDPRGIPERITYPDGTQRRFVHGVPASLGAPDRYEPTPWVAYEYDADDNARRTNPDAGPSWHTHSDTPATVEADPHGRTVTVVERLADDPAAGQPVIRELTTRIRRDIDGNATEVTDALGRLTYRARYDLLGRAWREWTVDAGTTRTVYDPLGTVVEHRDDRGALSLYAYDRLHRLSRCWGRDGTDAPMLLQHAVLYGDDSAAPADAADRNLRGQRWRSYDPAGMTMHERCDVHGNPQQVRRRWLPVDDLDPGVHPPARRWPPEDLHDPQNADAGLDAANLHIDYVRDRSGAVHALAVTTADLPTYAVRYHRDTTGDVTAADLRHPDGHVEPVIEQILPTAAGQPVLVRRPELATRYLRDPLTSRLLRQHTQTGPGGIVYDARLEYDPLGTVIRLDEISAMDGAPRTYTFTYDDLHRLRDAGGYTTGNTALPWDPPAEAPSTACRYAYHYDDAGNLLHQHRTGNDQGETRTAALVAGTNRPATLTVDGGTGATIVIPYRTDATGNITAEGADRLFSWDAAGRYHTARAGSATAGHWYTDDDQRCCSVLITGDGTRSATHRLDGVVVNIGGQAGTTTVTGAVTLDGTADGTPLAWTTSSAAGVETLHLVTDHLGSIRTVLTGTGDMRQATDYTPYGHVGRRRGHGGVPRPLGYTTGEEDSPANVLLLGRRPYAPWLGRFLTGETLTDQRTLSDRALSGVAGPADPPNRRVPGWAQSPYLYAANSPLTVRDVDGRIAEVMPDCRTMVVLGSASFGAGFGGGYGKTPGANLGFNVGKFIGETLAPLICGPAKPDEQPPKEKEPASPKPDGAKEPPGDTKIDIRTGAGGEAKGSIETTPGGGVKVNFETKGPASVDISHSTGSPDSKPPGHQTPKDRNKPADPADRDRTPKRP